MIHLPTLRMVVDVEAVGLHGEGFSVGWVVMEDDREIDSGYSACNPGHAYEGATGDRIWIEKNVVPNLPTPTIKIAKGEVPQVPLWKVRQAFWGQWLKWKELGATLWADCGWPAEARFLIAFIDDGDGDRNWDGPYPFCEISTVFICAGLDPLAKYDRLPNELPVHHPTCDARQSARLLIEALAIIESMGRTTQA